MLNNVPVIDAHVHCWNNLLASRVVRLFAAQYGYPPNAFSYDGSIGGLIEAMDDAHITKSVILPVATKETQVAPINAWLEPFLHHERIVPFAAVYPGMSDCEKTIASIAAAGFKGVKLHPLNQHFRPQEERLFPLYEAVIKHDLILTFHAGAGMDYPDIRGSREDFELFFERYPYEKTVLAHLGGLRTIFDDPEAYSGQPGYKDLAYLIGTASDESVIAACRAHGIDRILFGSDGPWGSSKAALEHIKTMDFSPDELRAILFDNAANLLGLSVLQ